LNVIDDVSDITVYYNNTPGKEHARLQRHQLEFDLTWRYLENYLPSSGRVLELGSATGRYTLGLAKMGYTGTAVDISATLLEKNRRILKRAGLLDRVTLVEADVRDLSCLDDETYDAALVMGPLYHLVVRQDRELAITEVCRHLKQGSVLFSSFISRYGIMGELVKKVPGWIEQQGEVRSVIEEGKDPDDYPRGGFRGYFATVAEIAPLHESAGLETLVVAGVEPCISADDRSYNRLSGEQRQLWLELFLKLSTEPTTIGASRHLLYVGRKIS
jgi:S-adenosylmethionine-dependent methyltransferase